MAIHRLTRRLRFPNHWPAVGAHPEKPRQRLSPTPYSIESLSRGSHYFKATEKLYVGKGRWSQVYAGSLVSPSSPPIHGLELDDVVLKVYNPTFFPYPNPDLEYPELEAVSPEEVTPDSFRHTDEIMAWTEAYSYSKLRSLQGKVIPHFIDAFMVKFRNSGKENIAIAMSRVLGKSFVERCYELGSETDGDTRWFPIVRTGWHPSPFPVLISQFGHRQALDLFRKVYEIHQLGIIAVDIREQNIRVVGDPNVPNSPLSSVVIFDFGFARPRSFPTEEERKYHKVERLRWYDLVKLMNVLSTVCGDRLGEPKVGSPANRLCAFLRWVRAECTDEPWFEDWWAIYFSEVDIDRDF